MIATTHKHAPWRKSMLVPFWCIQIVFMLIFIVILGLAEGFLVTGKNNNDENWDVSQFSNVNDPEQVVHVATDIVVPIWIGICTLCLVLTITEIILLARHKLKPVAFLIMNVIKSGIWTVLFVLDVVSAVTEGGRTVSVVGITIDGVLLLSFWIPLIYGSVICCRVRREKKSYQPVEYPYGNPADISYESQLSKPYNYATRDVHSDLEVNTNMGTGDIGAAKLPARARGPSFSHERDTRYEAYRKYSATPDTPTMPMFEGQGKVGGSDIPQVYVEHHDGQTYEMESRSGLR